MSLLLPFLFFNDLMKKVARPLTQPTRLLVMSLVSFGVCILDGIKDSDTGAWKTIGMGTDRVHLVGGTTLWWLGVAAPTTALPTVDCEIPGNGGVLSWPEDRKDGELGLSRLLQMSHNHATPQMGIASWKQADKTAMYDIRGAEFSFASRGGTSKGCIDLVLPMYWLRIEMVCILSVRSVTSLVGSMS